jgi:hypothetical protein
MKGDRLLIEDDDPILQFSPSLKIIPQLHKVVFNGQFQGVRECQRPELLAAPVANHYIEAHHFFDHNFGVFVSKPPVDGSPEPPIVSLLLLFGFLGRKSGQLDCLCGFLLLECDPVFLFEHGFALIEKAAELQPRDLCDLGALGPQRRLLKPAGRAGFGGFSGQLAATSMAPAFIH